MRIWKSLFRKSVKEQEWLTTALPWGITNKFDESVNISGNLIYAYNETCCPDKGSRFNDGQALILDIDSYKVWYVGWNW